MSHALPVNPSPQRKSAPRRGAEAARQRRFEGEVVGALTSAPAASKLPLVALGALVALCRFSIRRYSNGVVGLCSDEVTAELERFGLGHDEVRSAQMVLFSSGVLAKVGGSIELVGFHEVAKAYTEKFHNRSVGRGKVLAFQVPVVPQGAPEPAMASATVNPETPAASLTMGLAAQAELLPLQPSGAMSADSGGRPPQVRPKQRLVAGRNNRIGPVDGVQPDESDPTAARVLCECGGTAEITQGLVDHLQAVYVNVDALQAIRDAAIWCDGNRTRRKTMGGIRRFLSNWLRNASRDAEVRAAVVRSSSQKGNGFGRGGSYDHAPSISSADAGHSPESRSGDELDFEDLNDAAVDVLGRAPVVEESAVARVSAVQAARARRTASSLPVAQPGMQRRLSEQLRGAAA